MRCACVVARAPGCISTHGPHIHYGTRASGKKAEYIDENERKRKKKTNICIKLQMLFIGKKLKIKRVYVRVFRR